MRTAWSCDDSLAWDDGADAWLRRILTAWVARRLAYADPESRAAVVEWFVDRRELYVRWHDEDRYHPEYDVGAGWVIRWDMLNCDAAHALDAVRYPTLEMWLTALYTDELADAGPEEPYAGRLVKVRRTRSAQPRRTRRR